MDSWYIMPNGIQRAGSNVLICFMVRNVIERVATPYDYNYLSNSDYRTRNILGRHSGIPLANAGDDQFNLLVEFDDKILYIAATLTILVAFFHGIIYVFRLEFIFSYLSEHLLVGFSVGMAFRIALSQVQHIINVNANLCVAKATSISVTTATATSEGSSLVTHSPSYFHCMFWAAYRRLFGVDIVANATISTPNIIRSKGAAQTQTYLSPASSASRIVSPQTVLRTEVPTTKCISTMWDCLESINLETLALSIFAIVFLLFTRQMLSPYIRSKIRFTISFEFVLIVILAFLSQLFNNENYRVETVKYVSDQFRFVFPRLVLFGELSADALAIALLTFALHIHLSNVLRHQRQHNNQGGINVKWNERQELLAFITMGFVSSFIGAYPAGDSQRRARIAVNGGAKSTVVNMLLVLTLLPISVWWTVFIRTLPICILSCIVLLSISELFAGLSNLNQLWQISRLDVMTFGISCLLALLLPNTSYALFGSIIFAASTVLIRLQWPTFQLLVNVTGSGAYYAEKAYYGSELDESGVVVMRYEAPIFFNNVAHFKMCVLRVADGIKGQLLGVGIGTRAGSMKSMKSINTATGCYATGANAASIAASSCKDFFSTTRSTLLISGDVVPNYDVLCASADQPQMSKVLILDFSAVSSVDVVGFTAIKELFEELTQRKIRLLFAAVNSTIRMGFKINGGFEVIAKAMFFPSVHDAVLYSQQLGGVIAPSIHMSVSMNGCRDLIALSATTSNLDMCGGLGAGSANYAYANTSATAANNTDTSVVGATERPQSGGAMSGSFTNLTIGSNNSQVPSLHQQAASLSSSGFVAAVSATSTSDVSATQTSITQKSVSKLGTRHSNA